MSSVHTMSIDIRGIRLRLAEGNRDLENLLAEKDENLAEEMTKPEAVCAAGLHDQHRCGSGVSRKMVTSRTDSRRR